MSNADLGELPKAIRSTGTVNAKKIFMLRTPGLDTPAAASSKKLRRLLLVAMAWRTHRTRDGAGPRGADSCSSVVVRALGHRWLERSWDSFCWAASR